MFDDGDGCECTGTMTKRCIVYDLTVSWPSWLLIPTTRRYTELQNFDLLSNTRFLPARGYASAVMC